MLTLREGRRFASRSLHPAEIRIVLAALKLWERSPEGKDAVRMRAVLADGQLLAMGSTSFSRAEERSTFGYRDERGRILLNPNLCFAQQRMSAPRYPDSTDVAATMFTLYHESRHLLHQASEEVAYEDEWRFVRGTGAWTGGLLTAELARDIGAWEQEMPGRIKLYLGGATLDQIRARVEAPPLTANTPAGSATLRDPRTTLRPGEQAHTDAR
jgi:hypothetical protein